MSAEQIIEYLAKTKYIENFIRKISKGESQFNLDDLAQELYLDLLNKPPDKIEELWKNEELDYFIYRMIANNLYSKTSPYHKLYRNIIYLEETLTNDKEDTEGEY